MKAIPPAVNHLTPLGISSTSPIQLKISASTIKGETDRAAVQ